MQSNGITILSLIYMALSISAGALIIRNSADPEAAKNVGILLGSLLPVVIAIAGYLTPTELVSDSNITLFYDSKTKRLISGDPEGPYSLRFGQFFGNVERVSGQLKFEDAFSPDSQEKCLNVAENGILATMMIWFQNNWDLTLSESKIVVGKMTQTNTTNAPSDLLTAEMIRNIFKGNPIASNDKVLIYRSMAVPRGTVLSRTLLPTGRAITFSNGSYKTEISFWNSTTSVVQLGVWGILPRDKTRMNRFYAITIQVRTRTTIGKSVGRTERLRYVGWHENIGRLLAQYDWSQVETDVDRVMLRRTEAKVLGIPYGWRPTGR